MGFIDTLKERAKANVKTIVLPETEDKRTLAATEKILKEGIAKVILVGNEEAVKKSAAEDGSTIVFTFAFALSLSVSINPMIKMAPSILHLKKYFFMSYSTIQMLEIQGFRS